MGLDRTRSSTSSMIRCSNRLATSTGKHQRGDEDVRSDTTLNRQGHDVGTQYRSAVFYHSPEQKQIAEEVIAAVTKEKFYVNPIVTEITPAGTWYEAESYHQEYFARNPFQGYCTAVIEPKVVKFRKQFVSNLKT